MVTPPHPPSVDALARVMAASGLPHAVCVELAREAVAAGPAGFERSAALTRANVFARLVAGAGDQCHRRVVAHQPRSRSAAGHPATDGPEPRVRSADRRARVAATGSRQTAGDAVRGRGRDRRQQQRLCGAAGARCRRPRSSGRGQSRRERGDRRWVPHPRRDGAIRRDLGRRGYDQSNPTGRLPQGDRPQDTPMSPRS